MNSDNTDNSDKIHDVYIIEHQSQEKCPVCDKIWDDKMHPVYSPFCTEPDAPMGSTMRCPYCKCRVKLFIVERG